jgi:hypothetical protein
MPSLKLNILVIPTYNALTLAITDISTYPIAPPINNPTIEITVPGFDTVVLPFIPNTLNVFNSTTLGITSSDDELLPLPDGIYYLKYSTTPSYDNFVDKSIIRIEQLQERFDSAFMTLDMMECDRAIKTQQKVDLTSINFFIQGAIAAANNCAIDRSNKLYIQASKMLNNFIKNGCKCYGNNYLTNFQ